jgi:acyl carrier protein
MANDMKRSIREFIEMSFLFREGRVRLTDEESLLAAGLIDSTGILELVTYLESQFAIVVEDAEIVPENLDSVDKIACYVARKQTAEQETAIAV